MRSATLGSEPMQPLCAPAVSCNAIIRSRGGQRSVLGASCAALDSQILRSAASRHQGALSRPACLRRHAAGLRSSTSRQTISCSAGAIAASSAENVPGSNGNGDPPRLVGLVRTSRSRKSSKSSSLCLKFDMCTHYAAAMGDHKDV